MPLAMAPKTGKGKKAKSASPKKGAKYAVKSPRKKGKAAGGKQVSPKKAVATGRLDDAMSPAAPKRVRAQEDRRDAEVRAVRALGDKFSDFDVETWKCKRSPTGLNPIEHVMQEQSKRRANKQKLGTKYWGQFVRDFCMLYTDADKLKVPVGEDVGKEDIDLMRALAVAKCGNPAGQPTAPLERYLSSCVPLSRAEQYGLFRSVQVSPELQPCSAFRAQVATAAMLARTRGHEAQPDYWQVMKRSLDEAMKWHYEEMSEAGVRLMIFLGRHMAALSLWHSPQDLLAIQQAGEKGAHLVAEQLRRVVKESAVGKVMFQDMWNTASRHLFRDTIVKDIAHLVEMKFVSGEVATWRAKMGRMTQELLASGHNRYQKVTTSMRLWGFEIVVTCECPEDEYEWRLAAAIKDCALNSGQFAPLVYEAAILVVGHMHEISVCTEVPEEHMGDIISARQAARDFCVGKPTLSKVVAELTAKKRPLLQLDRSFECDLAWLDQCASQALARKVSCETLRCMPSNQEVVELKDAVRMLGSVMEQDFVKFVGESMLGDVEAVHSLVCNVHDGYACSVRKEDKHSQLFSLVLKRAERWYSSTDTAGQVSMGEDGIKKMFAALQQGMETGGGVGLQLSMARPLRVFGWMLSRWESDKVDEWINVLADREAAALRGALTDAAPPVGAGEVAPSSGAGVMALAPVASMASSSSSRAAPMATRSESKPSDAEFASLRKMFAPTQAAKRI